MTEAKSVLAQSETKSVAHAAPEKQGDDVHKIARDVRMMTIIALVSASLSLVSLVLAIISAANLGAIAANTTKNSGSSSSQSR